MSEPVTLTDVLAVLLAAFGSLPAPVVPLTAALPTAVGVPETVHAIEAPGANATGGVGEHDVVNPAGKPVTAQVAADAVIAGAAAFVHVNEPA